MKLLMLVCRLFAIGCYFIVGRRFSGCLSGEVEATWNYDSLGLGYRLDQKESYDEPSGEVEDYCDYDSLFRIGYRSVKRYIDSL